VYANYIKLHIKICMSGLMCDSDNKLNVSKQPGAIVYFKQSLDVIR